MRALLSACLCLSLALPLRPEAAGFYFRGQEGWFWYKRELEPQPAPERPSPTPRPIEPTQPSLAESAPKGPRPLSAQWLREHLGAYRDAAIDDPSPQNVALYLYLQRVALDKSSRFAAATQRAVQRDPFLDELTQRPTATFAANLVNREAGEARDQVLSAIAAQAGLLFFFRSDCPYCEAQAPLLEMLATRYGFAILPVSLDGAPLPGGVFPTFSRDRGQAQALGVVSTPALFLARPPDALLPLSQGLLSLAQLKDRVVGAAVDAGWISADVYTRTRPVTADLTLAAGALPETLPDDPAALLQALQGLARVTGEALAAGGGAL
jgi:conjugal transfer pilus assembly protein TraF